MERFPFFRFLCSLIICSILEISFAADDTISPGQYIKDGETLVSLYQIFELGFFSPGKSNNRYLGIWYKFGPQRVVWVANRVSPIAGRDGVLTVSNDGNLVLLNQNKTIIWSSNSIRVPEYPVAQLLDSGNLVLREELDASSENYMWQSFDYPSDTLLTGMKLGLDLRTGFERYLTSWTSADDPTPSEFSLRLDVSSEPQLVVSTPSKKLFRSGPWNGQQFGGIPITQNSVFKPILHQTEDGLYYGYEPFNSTVITIVVMNPIGRLQRSAWNDKSNDWSMMYSWPFDQCDNYAQCGANSYCRVDKIPSCKCLNGFVPKSQDEWDTPETRKCARKSPSESDCRNGEGFLKLSRMKLPDSCWSNHSLNIKECRAECLKNCSCRAYAKFNEKRGDSGCLMWFGDLIDMKECTTQFTWGQDIFLRVPASELDNDLDMTKIIRIAMVILTISAAMFILGLLLCNAWKKKSNEGTKENQTLLRLDSGKEDIEVHLFDLSTIVTATNNFSTANMIGEGGFGPVYKGNLSEGPEIAVKRLAKESRQGLEEFKTEVVLIGKLQHRNLVGLIGGCMEGDERMLIYEYMPNKSLDYFIFDCKRAGLLSWTKRFDIVIGIARGLLYLHQDSKLQIVHRDLKISNILLDSNLNPKISDFGLARIFSCDDKEVNTNRVVGTYGYMSPEYAAEGTFSMKSDVCSFGVVLLEIISGKRNRGFRHPDHQHNLIGHAWLLWNHGKSLELVDKCLEVSSVESEVQRCIQVGLLCVQKFPDYRPEMSSIVFMLANEGVVLPQPGQPGFFMERGFFTDTSSSKEDSHSVNAMTITTQTGR